MTGQVELLAKQLAEACEFIRDRVDGLTDEEFFWKPSPGAWTVHPDDHGRWFADYEEPDPEPAPITAIGWRLVHVVECKLMYHEYAFGPARLTWPELVRRTPPRMPWPTSRATRSASWTPWAACVMPISASHALRTGGKSGRRGGSSGR
jgi:DinB superfamily